MIKIYRNTDAEDGGGGAPAEVQNPQGTTTEQTEQSTEATPDVPEFQFALDDEDVELPNGSEPKKGEKDVASTTEVVSKKDYEELKVQLAEATRKLEQLQKLSEHPVMQKTAEFLLGVEADAEADPAQLHEQLFGINVSNLSLRDLVTKNLIAESKDLGVQLTTEQLEASVEEEISNLESESNPLVKARKIKELRDKVKSVSGTGVYQKIQEKLKERQKASEYWSEEAQKFEVFLDELVKKGVKEFGLTDEFTKEKREIVVSKIQNGVYRYKTNGSVDQKHLIETMLFAHDPTAYIKKVEDKLRARLAVEDLKKRTGGNNVLPTDPAAPSIPPRQKGQFKDLSKANPFDWDPRTAEKLTSN